jgi:hypothetical protein
VELVEATGDLVRAGDCDRTWGTLRTRWAPREGWRQFAGARQKIYERRWSVFDLGQTHLVRQPLPGTDP